MFIQNMHSKDFTQHIWNLNDTNKKIKKFIDVGKKGQII